MAEPHAAAREALEAVVWRHTHGVNPDGHVICFPCIAAELASVRAELEQAREALDEIKGNVYLYRIEHLTPDGLVRGIEESLVRAYAALAAGEPAADTIRLQRCGRFHRDSEPMHDCECGKSAAGEPAGTEQA